MKKIYFVIFMVVFSITAMATIEEEVLSKAPSAVKEQLRESLKSGLNNTEILNVYGMLIQSRYSYEEQKKDNVINDGSLQKRGSIRCDC